MRNYFEFHAVGQGLFYTGSINNGLFNFVYDCGTDNSKVIMEREIIKYSQRCATIDFFVLSHLHFDHFSGLVDLMKVGIRKIYLPYLGQDHNLIDLILAYEIFCRRSSAHEDDEYQDSIFKFMKGLYSNESKSEVEYIGQHEEEQNSKNSYVYSEYRRKEHINCKHDWIFLMCNKRINDACIAKLNNDIDFDVKINGALNVEGLVKTKSGISIVKKIYEKHFGKGNNLNLTSTILIHYPIVYNEDCLLVYGYENVSNKIRIYPNVSRLNSRKCIFERKNLDGVIKTLLTGDAKFDDYLLSIVERQFVRSRYSILQIPHHGSKNNWDSMAQIKDRFEMYVVSFGLGNRYRHPNSGVIEELMSISNSNVYCSTQINSIEYSIELLSM